MPLSTAQTFKIIFAMSLVSILVLALLPVEMLSAPVFNWWDKAQHSLAFAFLSLLGYAAFPRRGLRVAAGLIVYGGGIELAQLAVGWRFAEWQDLLADCAGVFFAFGLFRIWQWQKIRKVNENRNSHVVGNAISSQDLHTHTELNQTRS